MLGELVLQGFAAVSVTAVFGVVVAVLAAYPLSKTKYYNPEYSDVYGQTTLEGALDAVSVLVWLGIAFVVVLAALGGIVEVIQWAV